MYNPTRSHPSHNPNNPRPSFMSWSNLGPQLAIGSAKGNLMVYNRVSKKKYPIWVRLNLTLALALILKHGQKA
eukprot:641656-Amorphochlora_amoeboformis.AAC.1